jgi:hypothetical protein
MKVATFGVAGAAVVGVGGTAVSVGGTEVSVGTTTVGGFVGASVGATVGADVLVATATVGTFVGATTGADVGVAVSFGAQALNIRATTVNKISNLLIWVFIFSSKRKLWAKGMPFEWDKLAMAGQQ